MKSKWKINGGLIGGLTVGRFIGSSVGQLKRIVGLLVKALGQLFIKLTNRLTDKPLVVPSLIKTCPRHY